MPKVISLDDYPVEMRDGNCLDLLGDMAHELMQIPAEDLAKLDPHNTRAVELRLSGVRMAVDKKLEELVRHRRATAFTKMAGRGLRHD